MTAPIEGDFRELMNDLARRLDRFFNGDQVPKPNGFCLIAFRFNDLGENPGRINYISNAERADMITALKELLARFEGRIQETETLQ